MNQMIVLITLILVVSNSSLLVSEQCSCNELLFKEDCLRNSDCSWISNICQERTKNIIRKGYCPQVSIDQCNQIKGCALIDNHCTFFTGCASYKQNTNEGCQTISAQCVSDGKKCVSLGECSTYLTNFSCKKNYLNDKFINYCHWEPKSSICRLALNCDELPKGLSSDLECREQINTCTARASGGCIQSGKECSDQLLEFQCVSNLNQTNLCYWDGKLCKDKLCTSASLTYTTDNQCKDFIDTCTTKKGGGCTNRLACSDSKIVGSCVTNNLGEQCIWLNNQCVDRICQNGNLDMVTNQQCQTILSTCITKFGGGCINNGQCSDASNIQGCDKDLYGNKCYWSGYECLLKTCDIAPLEIVSDISCEQFMIGCILSPLGQGCILNSCNAIEIETKCTIDSQGNNCVWRPHCDINTCSNAPISKLYNSHLECNEYNDKCTVNDNFKGCMEKKFNCSEYKEYQCYYTQEGNGCIWINQECVDRNCDNAPVTLKNHKECYNYLNTCTVNTNLQGCMELKINCNQYELNEQCVILQNSNECQWANNKCSKKTCDIAPTTNSYNTVEECSTYLSTCTIQDRINNQGCIPIGTECQYLQQKQCTYLLDGTQCFWNQSINQCETKNCSHFLETNDNQVTYANCNSWLKKCTRGPGFNPTKCVDKPQSCLDVNITELQCVEDINGVQCAWLFGICKVKVCEDYPYQATRSNCEGWMAKCTIGTGNKCKQKGSCEDFGPIQDSCTTDVNGISCVWYGGTCKDKKCEYASEPYSNIICQSWLSSCINKTGNDGCVTKQVNCQDYDFENQCYFDLAGNPCEWKGSTINKCIQKTCSTITTPLTSPNNSHETCETYLKSCTINNSKDACQIKQQSCSGYGIEDNCHTNLSGGKCFWDGSNCMDLSCQNASIDLSFDTDAECKAYLPNCMVANDGGCEDKKQCHQYLIQTKCLTSVNGMKCYWNSLNKCVDHICTNAELSNINHSNCQSFSTQCTSKVDQSGGCEILKSDCKEYLGESQCYIDNSGNQCIWDQISCRQLECSDAKNTTDFTYDSHLKCYDFLLNNNCTVNQLLNGCTIQMEQCQDYLKDFQCSLTLSKQQCYWYKNQCLLKQCSDTHETTLTPSECSAYLNGCQLSKNTCRIQVCEDFIYQTDLECKNASAKCTTNGSNCILRGTCEQIPASPGCLVDYQGRLCGWNSHDLKCEYLNCETAPTTLITEQQCETYFPGSSCTTRSGGGCTQKTQCQNAFVEEACTTSIDNEKCFWTGTDCRLPVCSDYFGTTVAECQKQKSECTSDGKQCQNLVNCISSLEESICFIGTEGVCFWDNRFCRPYISCESIPLSTHQECLTTLGTCVSDGTICISQRICSEYQSLFQCKFGLDGQCAWLKQSNECILFRSCYDYKGITHEDCFNYSQNCTSDGVKCIVLTKCSLYANSIGCHINQDGQQTNTQGQITSTGQCIWSHISNTCQDIDCGKLVGLNHESCFKQLSNCTSNGEQCIKMQQCKDYEVSYCNKAEGTDGICYLNESICTPFSCDKYNQTICESKSFCYYNGTICQQLLDCKEYESQQNCNYGNGGDCIWNGASCSVFSSCSDANNNQDRCRDYNNKCYWISASDQNSSQCIPHTCQTKYQIGQCQNIYSFNEESITLCNLVNSNCVELKPDILTFDNCFDTTLGLFKWNGTNCLSCQIITTPNTTETNNTQSSKESYLLPTTILLLGILLNL